MRQSLFWEADGEMLMQKAENTFMAFDKSYHEAEIAYFGAPFDGTASFRKGTRGGPGAIREDSYGLETYSPYQNLDLEEDTQVIDLGDLDFSGPEVHTVLKEIGDFARGIYADKKIPLMAGGEHLVSLPVIAEAVKAYPKLHIIHLDAHMDLREDYLDDPLSHATVMRRAYDLVGPGRIHQYGIRSGTREEFRFSREHCSFHPFSLTAMEGLAERLKGLPVYLSLDLDVLDPGIFPGTGTQEPGGVSFKELLEGLMSLQGLHLIGADVVELAPNLDPSGVSTSCACKVIRELALLMSINLKEAAHGKK